MNEENKESLSAEKLLERSLKIIERLEDETEVSIRSQKRALAQDREIMLELTKRQKAFELHVLSRLQSYHEDIQKVVKLNEMVDETLCNVLLAIRQNEYLQAWYPAQNGQAEQKVVGKYVR
jgi:hypothetical protein